MKFQQVVLCLTLAVAVQACKSGVDDTGQPQGQPSASFALIQSRIFTTSCVQCHNTKDQLSYAHLDLSGDSAFDKLVNAPTYREGMDAFGLGHRVVPGQPDSSFLLRKLTGPLEEAMGDRMPQGGHPLSNGKIEFVRQWILHGAPKTGSVADTTLLNDNSYTAQAPLTPLASPAKGFQLHMEPFDIPAGGEREIFVYKTNPMPDTQYMKSIDVAMRDGSHHFILWNVDGAQQGLTDGVVRERSDIEMNRPRDFVTGSQTLLTAFNFPPGIAVAIPPQMGFDFNSHYVNPSDQVYHGEAYVNVNTVDKSEVQHVATPFLVADQNFRIPAHSTYTRKYYWTPFTAPSHLLVLSSHAHRRMVSYKIWKNGPSGELLYSSDNWHEPPIAQMDVLFAKGERLYSETTWVNETDKPLNFGFTSDDEMSVIFGYYWQ